MGIDESGRGPLAGPVTAAAVTVGAAKIKNQKLKIKNILWRIKDSKRLTAKKREKIYEILKNHPEIEWGIGRVSERVIDRINILQATKLAMIKAVKKLKIKNALVRPSDGSRKKSKIDFLIIDGNFGIDLDIPQKSVIKGDEKVFLIKLASIIAKVTRDKTMLRYHKKYPQYGFDKHKGYGTRLHFQMLKKYGPCKIHRKSFSLGKNGIIK